MRWYDVTEGVRGIVERPIGTYENAYFRNYNTDLYISGVSVYIYPTLIRVVENEEPRRCFIFPINDAYYEIGQVQ
jgi:hypothetical protein